VFGAEELRRRRSGCRKYGLLPRLPLQSLLLTGANHDKETAAMTDAPNHNRTPELPAFRSLEGQRILLTGGAGAVGSAIVDQLVGEQPAEILVFEKFTRGRPENLCWALANGPVRIIEGDLRDPKAVHDAMQGVDLVFHLAAIRVTQCAEEPRLALEVMVDGTFNMAEAAVSASVDKVVAASSASVYGMAEVFPTPENHHPYANRTLYGAAKTFNEGLLRSFNDRYGLEYAVVRYFNVYGPRIDIFGPQTEVLVRWMQRIEDGAAPLILGDGTQTMDFIHVDDVARATILAAKADVTDEIFNVGSGVETSLNDLAGALLKVMGSDLTVEYGPERSVNPVPRRLADTTKARQLLGFEATSDLESGLRDLVAWWRVAKEAGTPAAAR
jgi:UDP-glucose 4-epimerase